MSIMNDKPYKINSKDYTNIYFTSDWHINHDRNFLFSPRGFGNIQDHDKWILDQLYATKYTDLIFFLGDMFLSVPDDREVYKILNRIPAKIIKITGNHCSYTSRIYNRALNKFWAEYVDTESLPYNHGKDWVQDIYPFSVDFNGVCLDGTWDVYGYPGITNDKLVFMGESALFNIDKQLVYMKHMASLIYPYINKNGWHLCGHSHGNCPQLNPDHKMGKVLDVGLDNAKKYNGTMFFTWDEIKTIMSKKEIAKIDHH